MLLHAHFYTLSGIVSEYLNPAYYQLAASNRLLGDLLEFIAMPILESGQSLAGRGPDRLTRTTMARWGPDRLPRAVMAG